MPNPRVCLISAFDAENLTLRSILPRCSDHKHCSRKEAAEYLGEIRHLGGDGHRTERDWRRSAEWVCYREYGKRYLLVEYLPAWGKVYLRVSRLDGAPRLATLQLSASVSRGPSGGTTSRRKTGSNGWPERMVRYSEATLQLRA